MTRDCALWAQFASGDGIVAAAIELRSRGMKLLEAYTPYPLPELERTLEKPYPIALSRLTLLGACLGGGLAFLIIWWTAAVDYPLNVGGRPLNSIVADIPIVFESSVLGATLAAFVGFLWFSRLPSLSHRFESLPGFRDTSVDRFWLGIQTSSERVAPLSSDLRELGALRVELEPEQRS